MPETNGQRRGWTDRWPALETEASGQVWTSKGLFDAGDGWSENEGVIGRQLKVSACWRSSCCASSSTSGPHSYQVRGHG